LIEVNVLMYIDWEGRGHFETCNWLQEGSIFPRQEDDDVCL